MQRLRKKAKPQHCELCQREQPLSFHHLIPRKNHRKKYFKKQFKKADMTTRGAWLCKLCHNKLHQSYSEQELGKTLNTLDLIQEQDDIKTYLKWAKKQK